jgi:hypothetical protein
MTAGYLKEQGVSIPALMYRSGSWGLFLDGGYALKGGKSMFISASRQTGP